MRHTGFRVLLAAATLFIACGALSRTYAATLTIDPSSGAVMVGVPFTVTVSVSGLDPASDLYDYSFDLGFNPADFEALSAGDGSIFNYAGNSPIYIDGSIDNSGGLVSDEAGIDTFADFTGTGGLVGTFTFEALAPFAGGTITVQNVSLSTYNAASGLQPPDIDPGVLPVADLSAGSAVPEPATGALAGMVLACCALLRFARIRGRRTNPIDVDVHRLRWRE